MRLKVDIKKAESSLEKGFYNSIAVFIDSAVQRPLKSNPYPHVLSLSVSSG
jgi:HEPN domain-containing protein